MCHPSVSEADSSQARRLGVTQSPPCSEFHAGTATAECHHKFTTPNLRRALPTARKPASLVSSLSHSTVEMAITLPLASKLLFLLRFLTRGVMIMTRASQRGQRPSHYAHRCAHARPVLSSTPSSQGRGHMSLLLCRPVAPDPPRGTCSLSEASLRDTFKCPFTF